MSLAELVSYSLAKVALKCKKPSKRRAFLVGLPTAALGCEHWSAFAATQLRRTTFARVQGAKVGAEAGI
jgi:hypothetical protein